MTDKVCTQNYWPRNQKGRYHLDDARRYVQHRALVCGLCIWLH